MGNAEEGEVIVIDAGPAGCTAARYHRDVFVLHNGKSQAPSFPGLTSRPAFSRASKDPADCADDRHAATFGARIEELEVTRIERTADGFSLVHG